LDSYLYAQPNPHHYANADSDSYAVADSNGTAGRYACASSAPTDAGRAGRTNS
jgi:hypothetical protein